MKGCVIEGGVGGLEVGGDCVGEVCAGEVGVVGDGVGEVGAVEGDGYSSWRSERFARWSLRPKALIARRLARWRRAPMRERYSNAVQALRSASIK